MSTTLDPSSLSAPCGTTVFQFAFSGCRSIDGDQSASRSIQISLNPEHRPLVVDELVLRVEIIQHFHHLCAFGLVRSL